LVHVIHCLHQEYDVDLCETYLPQNTYHHSLVEYLMPNQH
jgi:hypothetical protein